MSIGTIGVLSPGDMGAAIGAVLTANGVDVVTSLKGRSELTKLRATEAHIRDVGGISEVIQASAMLLSVLAPSEAVSVAERVADSMVKTGRRPLFIECNAIAPKTVGRIATLIGDAGGILVDAGIIGAPPRHGSSTRLYCSGSDTSGFEELAQHGLDIRNVGSRIGQASGLKMVYAASTKGTTAVWTELLVAAEAMGLTEALLAEYGDAADPTRHIKATTEMPRRAKRWVGEMEEIAATFEHLNLTPKIFQGAADMYRLVSNTPLANQTSRQVDPQLLEMLRVLSKKTGEDRSH